MGKENDAGATGGHSGMAPGPVTVLALDTALGACSVAISRGNELLGSICEPLKRGHAEALLPMVDHVSRQSGIGVAEVGLFAVTVGPGTFTGVRIGLATARGLALALDRPLVGFSTLEVMALEAAPRLAAEDDQVADLLVVHDARRGEVYAQLFRITRSSGDERPAGSDDQAVKALSPPLLLELSGLAAILPSGPVWLIGSGAALAVAALPLGHPAKILTDAPVNPDAAILAPHAGRIHDKGLTAGSPPQGYFDQPAVRPLYLRAPDAKLPGGISI